MVEPLPEGARTGRVLHAAFSVALAAGVCGLSIALRRHISVSLLYVLPIGLMAWWSGRVPALILSTACAFDLLLVPTAHGGPVAHAPLGNVLVELGFFGIIAWTLAALRRALDHQHALATTDDVTGAPNRRAFYERARLELERQRRSGTPLTLAFLDLDRFKAINDRFGHQAGDELLREVAGTLSRSLRAVDFVARLGGDEFAILLPETDEAAARTVLEKLRAELNGVFVSGGWPVTSSAGAVTFRTPPGSIDAALAEADALLYSVKESGKDGVLHRSLGADARSSFPAKASAPHTRRR